METINLYIQPKMGRKCQAHNLKVVGSNPTPAINLFNKSMTYITLKEFGFWGFFIFYKYKIATFISTFKLT